LNPNTRSLGSEPLEVIDVLHGEILVCLDLVVVLSDIQSSTGDSFFQTRSRNLDTKSGLDLFVVDVGGLNIALASLRFDPDAVTPRA
jgi:hypothetical protein